MRAYEPDLLICWGFPWKIPQAALAAPRLGSINMHPALLPRHRGPIPLAWALREGDPAWGITWHRMDAELDTGNVLAQTTVPIADDDVDVAEFGPRLIGAGLDLLPRVLERVAACDPGSRSLRRMRAGPGTSRTTPTRASTGRTRLGRSTTRFVPGISPSASPGFVHPVRSSTARRSCSCRRA